MKTLKETDDVDEDEQELNLDKIEEEMEAYYSSEGEDNDVAWIQGTSATGLGGGDGKSDVRKVTAIKSNNYTIPSFESGNLKFFAG